MSARHGLSETYRSMAHLRRFGWEHIDQIGGPTLDRDAKARMKRSLQKAANGES